MDIMRTNKADRLTLHKRMTLGSAGYDKARLTLLSDADADGNIWALNITRAEAQTVLEVLQKMLGGAR